MRPEALSTPGFTIRSFQVGDGPALFEAVDASRAHLSAWLPWVDSHTDAAASELTACRFRAAFLMEENFHFVVVDPDNTRVLGGTSFEVSHAFASRSVPSAEIGMWVRADRAGQGLATEVLRALVGWGMGPEWGFRRLVWRCFSDNRASARVAEKAGFQLEGTLRGSERKPSGELGDMRVYARVR